MKKLWCGTISVMLVVVMLINMLPINALGIDNNSTIEVGEKPIMQETIPVIDSTEIEQMDEAQPAYVVEEDVSKRSAFYKEFILSNGLRLATIYPNAVHFEDDGQWKEIDNTLTTEIIDGQNVYTNTSGLWDVRFPQRLSDSNSISITKDGFAVSFGMAGEMRSNGDLVVASMDDLLETTSTTILPSVGTTIDSAAQVQQIDTSTAKAEAEYAETIPDKLHSRLLYPSVYSNTNIVYDLQSNQVKETIILQSLDLGLMGYRYTLDTGELIPVLNDDQSIELCTPDTDDIVMTMPAPFMLDANGEYCNDVAVSLVQNGATYLLSYYLPTTWLRAENRAWPVVLDPVVNANSSWSNIQDITVSENLIESNAATTLKCGYSVNYGIYQFYLRYTSLPTLTSADVIVSATIGLTKPSASTLSAPIEVHKVENPWTASQINWGTKPDYHPTVEDVVDVKDPGQYKWDVTDIVFGWYADNENTLANNTGMLFKAAPSVEQGGVHNWQQFCSSDYGSGLPTLTIEYINTAGLESYWDTTSTSAGRAGTGYVQPYSGNLTWVHNDIGFDGNRMPVSISHVYNTSEASAGTNLFGMGNGWRTNYNQRIYLSSLGTYVWEDGDGTAHDFTSTSGTRYEDLDNLGLILTILSSEYILTDKHGNKSVFDAEGRLSKQINNQSTASCITISYQSDTSTLISRITDGVGRKYDFTYRSGLLFQISYSGTQSVPLTNISFGYTNTNLTSITYQDSNTSLFSYTTKNQIASVTDIDGYKVSYSYNTLDASQPSRVVSVTESDDGINGNGITIAYTFNRTTLTTLNGTQTYFFNKWGNTTSVQDNEGNATFFQYATDVNPLATKHRLASSSLQQDTVVNLLSDTSFENSTLWLSGSPSSVICSISSTEKYYGSRSLASVCANSYGAVGASSGSYNVAAGKSVTFSAYLKTNGGLTLRISDGSTTVTSDILDSSNEWTRREVTYTNTTSSAKNVTLQIFHLAPGTAYIDCVQLEANQSASRYNLIVDSEFSSLSGPWHTYSTGTSHPGTSGGNAPPGLVANRARISGDTNTQQYIYQDIAVSGNAGDRYVFSGWFTGNSLPDNATNRFCGLRLTFKYTNGTTATTSISFTPNAASDKEWQYFAGSAEATDTYYAITFKVEYSYNANILLLDGMNLFKEAFGETYSYDTNGNIKEVRDILGQTTKYTYSLTNDLTEILSPSGVKTANTYDTHHNVTKSEKQYELYNEESAAMEWTAVETDYYAYDVYGNVKSHSSTADGVTKTTSATYNSTGNFLSSSTDADGNTTTYYYDSERSYLNWVQHPKDSELTRTYYDYDSNMFMLTRSYTTTDKNVPMSVNYTYSGDYLTCITTPSTAYTLSYGSFGQRTKVSAGNYTLAEYRYSADTNHRLVQLDYGNGDVVKYSYDTQGRVIAEAYHENGSTSASRIVTYAYDNNGALASMTDSKTGVTTTYYYDTLGRSTGQKETGDITHSLRAQYNDKGLVAHVKEFFNQTSKDQYYTYDEYDRLIRVAQGLAIEDYAYDNLDRLTSSITKHGSANVLTTSTTYDDTSDRVASQTLTGPGLNRTYQYTYDSNGNIASVNDGNYITTYEYDSQNQLIRENNARNLKTWTWTYDSAGNITSKKEYYYTAGDLGAVHNETKYTYGDSTWKDKLTAFNNKPITYDAIGNPLSDGTWSYTWEQGRQLAKMSSGSNIWNFTYDANGMRTGRSNTGTTYTYVYNGSQLSRMTYGPHVLQFTYGADGAPQSVTYNNTWYYYVTNLQGDVVAILNSSGTPVVYYYYDAWGKMLETSDYSGNGLGMINPLRYRGYVYDRETGLYYLQSRYYNPTWGRFINADSLIDASAGLAGNNMFAYCANNPIVYADSSGHWIETVFDLFSLGVSVVDVVINPLDPWAWAGLAGDALDLIPFVTGLGEGVKGMRVIAKGADLADDTLDTIRLAKAASYADEFTEGGLDLAKMLDKTSDGFTISNRLDGIKIHKSFMGNGMKIPGSRLRADGLDSVTKQLYELKPYNRNSLKKGVKQITKYNDELGGGYQMILVFY